MALNLMFVIVIVVVAAATNVATAEEFVVGDDKGWKVGVNYTAWAQGKEFFVGDSIVFIYAAGNHNVYKVTGPEFQACAVPKTAPLKSGKDVIALAAPGKKWYLCGFPKHCQSGMKLVINVQSLPAAPSPSPTPTHQHWTPNPATPHPSTPQPSTATTVFPCFAVSFAMAFAVLIKVLV